MSTLFRRIRSPREHKEREEHQPPNRSFSTGQLPAQGHRRHRSDDIKNINYTDPNGVSNSHGQDENPPLPPRNMHRPASVGNAHQLKKQVSSDEDPYYVAPADTIGRKAGLSVLPPPTASERKVMEMHERTQSQKVVGHRRTGSYGHVIDNSEYSTPWNLLQEQRGKEQKDKPPKPPRSRDRTPPNRPIIYSQPSDGSDDLIPVQSPPPPSLALDRSLTNSPCSPVDPSGDYDEPWDRKYPDLRMAVRRQHSGKNISEGEQAERSASVSKHSPKMSEKFPHDSHQGSPCAHHRHSSHHEPHPHQRNSRGSPQPETRQRENSKVIPDRISPPLILSGGGGGGGEMRLKSGFRSQSERLRQPSPQPDARPRLSSRVASERGPRDHHLSGVSDRTSPPLPPEHRDRSRLHYHSQLPPTEYLPPSLSPEGTPRSSSFSVPISARRLPSPPPDAGEPRLDNRRWTRTNSPPTVHIDLSLALENQQ